MFIHPGPWSRPPVHGPTWMGSIVSSGDTSKQHGAPCLLISHLETISKVSLTQLQLKM